MADQTRCPNCFEVIIKGAKICKHCGSRLTFSKHLQLSSLILSLLVALVSVATVALPVIKSTILGDAPIISGAVMVGTQHEVHALLTNTGTRSAAIFEVLVIYNDKQQKQVLLSGDYQNDLLNPGKTRRQKLTSDVELPQFVPSGFLNGEEKDPGIGVCKLLIRFVRHDGEQDETEIPYSCLII